MTKIENNFNWVPKMDMDYHVLETRLIYGQTLADLMAGVQAMEKDGWHPLGTPYPITLPHISGYGMMHMVYRDRKKD